MSKMSIECKVTNPQNQKAASLRSEHICTLVNAKDYIDPETIMAIAHHKSKRAHHVYKRKSCYLLDEKIKAFHVGKRKYYVSIIHVFILIQKSLPFTFLYSYLAAAAVHYHQLTCTEKIPHKTSSANIYFHHHLRYQTNTFQLHPLLLLHLSLLRQYTLTNNNIYTVILHLSNTPTHNYNTFLHCLYQSFNSSSNSNPSNARLSNLRIICIRKIKKNAVLLSQNNCTGIDP